MIPNALPNLSETQRNKQLNSCLHHLTAQLTQVSPRFHQGSGCCPHQAAASCAAHQARPPLCIGQQTGSCCLGVQDKHLQAANLAWTFKALAFSACSCTQLYCVLVLKNVKVHTVITKDPS